MIPAATGSTADTIARCHQCCAAIVDRERTCGACGANLAEWTAWRQRNSTAWRALRDRLSAALRGYLVAIGCWLAAALVMVFVATEWSSAISAQSVDQWLPVVQWAMVLAALALAVRVDLSLRGLPTWEFGARTPLSLGWIPAGAIATVAVTLPVMLGGTAADLAFGLARVAVAVVSLAATTRGLVILLRTARSRRAMFDPRCNSAELGLVVPVALVGGIGLTVTALIVLRHLLKDIWPVPGSPGVPMDWTIVLRSAGKFLSSFAVVAWVVIALAVRREIARWVDG